MLTTSCNIINQLPGYLGWKDKDLRYAGCNDNLARALHLPNAEKIVGLRDDDLATSEESLRFYRKYDQLALSGKVVRVLHNIGSPSPEKSFFLEKKPLLNDANIAGIIYYCYEVIHENLLTNLLDIDKKFNSAVSPSTCYNIAPTDNQFKLSVRELECLFCILRGMSAKKVGEIIGLSKRTVEFYMENIKNKLGCSSKSELLVIAIKAGYMDIVPANFLRKDLLDIFN